MFLRKDFVCDFWCLAVEQKISHGVSGDNVHGDVMGRGSLPGVGRRVGGGAGAGSGWRAGAFAFRGRRKAARPSPVGMVRLHE